MEYVDVNMEPITINFDSYKEMFQDMCRKIKEVPVKIYNFIIQQKNDVEEKFNNIHDSHNKASDNYYDRIAFEYNEPFNISIINSNLFYGTRGEAMEKFMNRIMLSPIYEFFDEGLVKIYEDPLLDREFYDFFKFKIMVENILKRPSRMIDGNKIDSIIDFILNLSKLFEDLLNTHEELVPESVSKLNEWDDKSHEIYLNKYNSFKNNFIKMEEEFYSNFYIGTDSQSETIVSINNLFME